MWFVRHKFNRLPDNCTLSKGARLSHLARLSWYMNTRNHYIVKSVRGHHYLGSLIGSEYFISNFIQDKVSEWVFQLEKLTAMAQTQPHASYSTLVGSLAFFTMS